MDKFKTKLMAHKLVTGFMAVVLLVGLVSVTVAATGFSWRNVESKVASLLADKVGLPPANDEELGSVVSPLLPGPSFGVGKDMQFSVTAPLTDATSTWAFASPFLAATTTASDVVVEQTTAAFGYTVATTTVELVRINFTSSTPSAFNVGCGSSASKFTTTTNSYAILTSDAVAAALGNFTVENGLTTTAGAKIGGGAVTKIVVGPSHPYIVCRISTAVDAEWSGADGVSPGDIAIRFSRVQ